MSDVTVTPTTLVTGTVSASIMDADGQAIGTAATDTFEIAAGGVAGGRLVLKFFDDGSSDTIVIKAGDRPPSELAGLGDLTFTIGGGEAKYICVETGRHLQDDGTIRVTCGDDGLECTAFIIPKSG